MKFIKLVSKFDKLVNRQGQDKQFKPEQLEKLQHLLNDKKSRYEAKLRATQDPDKCKKLETRLKVVDAQIEKLKLLPSNG